MRPQSFFRLAVASCLLFATDAFLYAQSRIATQTHVRSQDVDASRLDELIAQNRYLELQRDLSAAELSSSDRTYFEGIVADRTHNFADAIALLGKAVPDLKAHSAHRAAWALRALASDYFEAGRYEDSANAYAALLKNYRGQFHAEDLQEFSDNLHTYEMLRGAPAQVVAAATGFTVATRLDPLGNTDVPVSVGKTGRLNGLCEMFRVLKSGGRMLFSDALVVGEMISHEEINTRSWLLLLQSAGENERLSEHAGSGRSVPPTQPKVRPASQRSGIRHGRSAEMNWWYWRERAILKGLQAFLSCVHCLTAERRLLRYLYVADRGR